MSQTLTSTIALDAIRPFTEERRAITVGEPPSSDGGFRLGPYEGPSPMSKTRTVVIIALLTGTTLVSSFSTGLLTVGLPSMAQDLDLPANLLLWCV